MRETAPTPSAEIVGEAPTMTVAYPTSETCSVEIAARRLGLSRSKAYELARSDSLPVPSSAVRAKARNPGEGVGSLAFGGRTTRRWSRHPGRLRTRSRTDEVERAVPA